jgi:leucyl aminopeptidase (aminopeptidase T)
MLKADVVLTPLVVAIDHAAAVREAAAAGARVLAMGGISEEQLMAGGIDADFHAIAPICRKLADRMTQCSEARLTTEAGTDLTMDLRGRKAIALVPLLTGPGQVVGFSTIEATINPVAGASHGTIVVDASILLAGFRPLGPGESFTMKIENGKVTSIEGSGEAARLRRLLEGETDAHIRDVAQLAIGLNPLARLVPELSEAEGILGTAHIGIGSGAFLGGAFQAPMHFDVLMWNATLFLDGQIAFRDGTTVD